MRTGIRITRPEVAKAFSHPLRARILSILEQRRASPRELADELGQPLGNVSYHVRTLVGLKLIRLVAKTPRRGSIEHYYEAIAPSTYVTDDMWADTPQLAKRSILQSALNEVGKDVGGAAVAGGFDRRDAVLTRTPLVLDREAWSDLAEELNRLREWALSLEQESKVRLEKANHQAEVHSGLVLMLYEKTPNVDELAAALEPADAPVAEPIPAESSETPG